MKSVNKMPKHYMEIEIPVPYGLLKAKAWGDPNRHTNKIIALHGWQDNAGSFDTLIPLLPESLYIVALDFPGHGLSSHLLDGCPYHDLVFLMDLKRVVDHLKWSEFTILGHSMGAAIGLFYSCLYPKNVTKLIALDMVKPLSFPGHELAKRTGDCINAFLTLEQKNSKPPVYDEETAINKLIDAHAIYGQLTREAAQCLLKRGSKETADRKGKYFTRDNRIKAVLFQRMDSNALYNYLESIECHLIIIKAKNGVKLDPQEVNDRFIELYIRKCKSFKLIQVEGQHHVHLISPETVLPFVAKAFSDSLTNGCNGYQNGNNGN
ncbi:probable serine hydrolase [Oppia nitens]|uniref:probable serine hydrolase n=1 Tax=Oppia nitens TaxID=1686743 RepID=UPI0023DBBAC2|nr:probable serine hydrolase [Oppia nitens]